MLVALEINGFKSFADRTRFEFPPGITVVVGPNGSGKSNVADALKWVLGAQSVKALRGKEMTDVIFSGSRSRRQAGAAEASLIFDNSSGMFDHDGAEIQVTRRVYRSGEAEYLVNRQPCRLRDIRDLLASGGVSTSGYNIIEQGRVDAVLQSSAKERRLIFEEVAGISHFRIKRDEAARRLERVQQNLLRLGDIVDELQSRLKTVRAQAARAHRHAELSQRVELLRTQVAFEDWRQITAQMDALQAVVGRELEAAGDLERRLASHEAEADAAEAQAGARTRALREALSQEASLRERSAQCESARHSQLARIDELEQEVVRLSHQLLTLTSRAGDSQQLVEETRNQLESAQVKLAALNAQLAGELDRAAQLEGAVEAVRQEAAAATAELEGTQRETAALLGQRQLLDARLQAALALLESRDDEAHRLEESRARVAADARQLQTELVRSGTDFELAANELQHAANELERTRSASTAAEREVVMTTGRLSGARERIAVLEELEARLDGLTAGAKEALRRARDEPDGPFRSVRGVVADLLHVDADTAQLIEIALGDRANHLVVAETRSLAPMLSAEPGSWAGRTTFLRLDVAYAASAVDRVDLSGERGVMGRADAFVETAPELAPLVRRLLGRYWLVDSLSTAIRLAGGPGQGLNFVTVAGEALLADGTLAVGPRQSAAGLLSRRSELRALRDERDALQAALAEAERQSERLLQRIAHSEAEVRSRSARHEALQRSHSEIRLRAESLADKLEQADARLAQLGDERAAIADQIDQLRQQRAEGDRRLEELETTGVQCQVVVSQSANRGNALAAELAALQASLTELRVEAARSEQRVEGLSRQMEQLERDNAERGRALDETRARAAQCQAQRAALQIAVQEQAAEVEQLASGRAQYASTIAQLEQACQSDAALRTAAMAAADAARAQCVAVQARVQAAQMQLHQCQHARAMLVERMREDYQLDLEQLAASAASESPGDDSALIGDRGAVEAEIRELRERLQAGGPVNMESLAELEALESRSGGLAAQYDDLQQSRARLERMIAQVNGESRQMLMDAIHEVRGHFQAIFHKLFGGGEADLVIEDDAGGDVLECGISIVAKPPGKQPRNISLLSGGERTLTCVALLLAIFRSRPSPFCVLDEVDAALDEANIDRFCNLIKEFMHNTQFIVITHSKRTMTCSDTLHGVTMQESGVSKRVSVRFEDVETDGRIRVSAASDAAPQVSASAKAA